MNNDSDKLLERIRRMPHDVRQFVEKRLELFMIESGEKLANTLATFASTVVTGIVTMLGLFFLLLALAFYIGEVLGSTAAGFAIVGTLVLVTALVIHLLAPSLIEEKVREQIGRQFLESSEHRESVESRGLKSPGTQSRPEASSENESSDMKHDLNTRI